MGLPHRPSPIPFAHIVSSTLGSMALHQRVQTLLRILSLLLKQAVSKAVVSVRILWSAVRALVLVSRIRGGPRDSNNNHHGTYSSSPPTLGFVEPPCHGKPTPNLSDVGTISDGLSTGGIQLTFPGIIETLETGCVNGSYGNQIHASPIDIRPVYGNIKLQPIVPSALGRYDRKITMYVALCV